MRPSRWRGGGGGGGQGAGCRVLGFEAQGACGARGTFLVEGYTRNVARLYARCYTAIREMLEGCMRGARGDMGERCHFRGEVL